MKLTPTLATSAHPSVPLGVFPPTGGGFDSPIGKTFVPSINRQPVDWSMLTAKSTSRPSGSATRSSLPPQRAERDRVAQRLRRRDVVLPGGSRFAGEDVAGPRGELDLERAAHAADVTAEAHRRRREQRHADDGAEHRRVAVPADLRALGIALDEHFDELFGLESRERRRLGADGQDPVGNRLGVLGDRAASIVVVTAEVLRCALSDDAVQPDLVEGEPLDLDEQRTLFVRGQQVRLIHESGGPFLDGSLSRQSAQALSGDRRASIARGRRVKEPLEQLSVALDRDAVETALDEEPVERLDLVGFDHDVRVVDRAASRLAVDDRSDLTGDPKLE